MLELKKGAEVLGVKKVFCFTTTLSPEVDKGIKDLFDRFEFDKIYFSANRENIRISTYPYNIPQSHLV